MAVALSALQCTQISRFDVDTVDDLADTAPGDGACATTAGTCSLRAAIQEANAQSGRQEILLPTGYYRLSALGAYEDAAATGDLDILDDLAIRGLGEPDDTMIDAERTDRVFQVHPGASLVLEDLIVQGGLADADTLHGAGIFVGDGAKLNLHRTVVNGGFSESHGGGIYNLGQAVLLRSTVSYNHSEADGGGIYNEGTLALSMSTVSSNSAVGDGGGLAQGSSATSIIGNATFHGNSASDGGALAPGLGTLSIVNSILSGSPDGGNCTGAAMSSGGNNLSSDATCELDNAGDLTNTDPKLTGLHSFADKGLPVHALAEDSPAIGAGNTAVVDGARGDQLERVPTVDIQIGAAANLGGFGVLGHLYVPSVDVSSPPGGEVRVFNTVNHTLFDTIALGDVRAAAVDAYGNQLFLVRGNYGVPSVPKEIRAYAAPAHTLQWTNTLPGVPSAVMWSPVRARVYVVGSDFALNVGYVCSFNAATGSGLCTGGLDLAPLFVDADIGSTGDLIYITGDASGSGSEEIRIYSTQTETFLSPALVPTGNSSVAVAGGASPSRMYVNRFTTEVTMFPGWWPGTSPLGSLPKTVGAGDIAVHPVGDRVYVGNSGSLGVDVIDVAGASVTTTISAGGGSLAVHPTGWWVYGGRAFSTVDVINASSNVVSTSVAVPSGHEITKMAVAP